MSQHFQALWTLLLSTAIVNTHTHIYIYTYTHQVVHARLFIIINTSADGLSFVEEVEDVAASLVVQPEDRPKRFHFTLALVRFSFGWRK